MGKRKNLIKEVNDFTDGKIIDLNVGGQKYSALRSTLVSQPNSLLAAMFSGNHQVIKDKDGCFFIDRDGTLFQYILSYLRSQKLYIPKQIEEAVYDELHYFRIFPISLNVVHLSNLDCYSPADTELKTVMPRAQIQTIRNISDGCFSNCQAVLVSTWSSVDSNNVGNMLADFVDQGGTVVICLFSLSTGHTYPAGRFSSYHALIPAPPDSYDQGLGEILQKNHLIMQDIKDIQQGSDKRRGVCEIAPGSVEVIANWKDGKPFVAIRQDKKGLVISITCQLGGVGVKNDGLKLVANALSLYRPSMK